MKKKLTTAASADVTLSLTIPFNISFGTDGSNVYGDKNDDIPVQMGVYSFMPWGTCTGTHDQSYFGNVVKYLDWIFQYVPEEQVCKGVWGTGWGKMYAEGR